MLNKYKLLLFSIIASALLLVGCESNKNDTTQTTTNSKLQTELPGTWESVSLDVVINTVNGKDSTDRFTVEEANWVRRIGMQPVQTRFFTDGNKYVREFRNLRGEVTDTLRGRWNVFGDTLMLIEPTATYQYLAHFTDGKLQLRSTIDWDGDGEADDDYLATERKVSNYTN